MSLNAPLTSNQGEPDLETPQTDSNFRYRGPKRPNDQEENGENDPINPTNPITQSNEGVHDLEDKDPGSSHLWTKYYTLNFVKRFWYEFIQPAPTYYLFVHVLVIIGISINISILGQKHKYFNWKVVKKTENDYKYKIVYDCSYDHVWIKYRYRTWTQGSHDYILNHIDEYQFSNQSCWKRQNDKHVKVYTKSGTLNLINYAYCEEQFATFIDYRKPNKRLKKWGFKLAISEDEKKILMSQGKQTHWMLYLGLVAYGISMLIYIFGSPLQCKNDNFIHTFFIISVLGLLLLFTMPTIAMNHWKKNSKKNLCNNVEFYERDYLTTNYLDESEVEKGASKTAKQSKSLILCLIALLYVVSYHFGKKKECDCEECQQGEESDSESEEN